MHVRYLLAAYAPIENLIQGQDCPAKDGERYSAEDILRLREAFRAVRLDLDSRCSSINAAICLMTDTMEKAMRDYDFTYADTALFFTRNGFPITERELKKRFAMAEYQKKRLARRNSVVRPFFSALSETRESGAAWTVYAMKVCPV